jgi:hypothetical protein
MTRALRSVPVSADRWTNYHLLFCPHSKKDVTFRATWHRLSQPGSSSFPLLEDRDCDASVAPNCLAQTKSGRKDYFQCPHVADGLSRP